MNCVNLSVLLGFIALAMGVSINHVASMTIPAAAGVIWTVFGYERVFLAAALLAVSIAAVSTLVPPRTVPNEAAALP